MHFCNLFYQRVSSASCSEIFCKLSKSTRTKFNRVQNPSNLYIFFLLIHFVYFFAFYLSLIFTITLTSNPYPRSVSGSRIWLSGFWSRVNFERVSKFLLPFLNDYLYYINLVYKSLVVLNFYEVNISVWKLKAVPTIDIELAI